MNMKRNLLFVDGHESCAEIYSKALTVTLKDCNHMFSTNPTNRKPVFLSLATKDAIKS